MLLLLWGEPALQLFPGGLLVSLLGWASTSATSLFMSPLHF